MKNKKIIIAGGTGFIGQEMIKYFGKENHIIILTRKIDRAENNRNKYDSIQKEDLVSTIFLKWDGKSIGNWAEKLEGADLVINLAGKTVNCRYTEKNKREILNSRTDAVKAIGTALSQCSKPPGLWINASSATIYRYAEDRPQDEFTGEFQNGFSVNVCKVW